VTFNCTATGYPKPTITWVKENDSSSVQYNSTPEILTGDGNSIFSQLVITEVKSNDYGIYHCVAKNSAGVKTSSATLGYRDDAPSVEGTKGPLATSKRKNVEITAIIVPLSVAIMFFGGVSVFWQYFRGRCLRNQTYDNKDPEQGVKLTGQIQEEDQLKNMYDYIDNNPEPQEHEEVPLSRHSPEENPLLGVESQVKKPPQARPLPPIPQIEKESQRMEENSEQNVTCLGMLQSETQNPNFQTPGSGDRGNILEGQDIPLEIEKNTNLIVVRQETEKEPGLLPSRGSMSEPEAETKPKLGALGVGFSPAHEPPKVRELLPTPDFEATPPRPPKPTKKTKQGTKYNERSSSNSQEIGEDYEIDLKRLEVRDEVLGEGEFGIVYKGRYHCKDTKVIDVAVKQLKDTANKTEKVALLSEIQILKRAGRHPNIVNLVGACTQGENILLVTDLIPGGTLESLLTSKPAPGEHGKYENIKCALNDRDLIKIALQIASGMQHLESKKCIHGDLAARNVLIDENKVAKLGDFGLARDISDRGIYNKTSNGKVPWRWLSLESLRYLVYTSQSDVWSFGIVLWEITTFGQVPYPGIATPRALVSFLCSGRRMPRPDHCTEELYALMQSCWMENPLMRPTFEDITKRIKCLLRIFKKSYVNVQHDDITDDSETL